MRDSFPPSVQDFFQRASLVLGTDFFWLWEVCLPLEKLQLDSLLSLKQELWQPAPVELNCHWRPIQAGTGAHNR